MEPASTIVKKLGGATKVSSLIGVHRTRVSSWSRPKAKGGTDGVIPFRHVTRLIEIARSQGVRIDANDFLPQELEGAAPR